MSESTKTVDVSHLTAGEIMTRNPISIRAAANIREAIALFTDHNFRAAPVIDDAGKPVGVISQMDILIHHREQPWHRPTEGLHSWDAPGRQLPEGFSEEVVDHATVADVMTPFLFSVPTDARFPQIVEQMMEQQIHHLFVTDESDLLVGVISALDLLQRL